MEILTTIIFILFYIFLGLIWWRIFKKTGFHGAFGLLMLVPVVNFVMLMILAFKQWPIQQQLSLSGAVSSTVIKRSLSKPLVAVIIIAAIIPLAFVIIAIAVPNFARTKLSVNEAAAYSLVKNISGTIENYASSNNGNYPLSEYDLKYSSGESSYDNKAVNGYDYSLNLHFDGYEMIASPSQCGMTGTKIFIAETGGKIVEKDCR